MLLALLSSHHAFWQDPRWTFRPENNIKFDQSNFSLFDQYRADNKICFEVPFDSTSKQVVEVFKLARFSEIRNYRINGIVLFVQLDPSFLLWELEIFQLFVEMMKCCGWSDPRLSRHIATLNFTWHLVWQITEKLLFGNIESCSVWSTNESVSRTWAHGFPCCLIQSVLNSLLTN